MRITDLTAALNDLANLQFSEPASQPPHDNAIPLVGVFRGGGGGRRREDEARARRGGAVRQSIPPNVPGNESHYFLKGGPQGAPGGRHRRAGWQGRAGC